MHILLTVPHGNFYLNDVVAPHIAKHLAMLLDDEPDITYELLVNTAPRSTGDMNRPQTRGTPWRNKVEAAMEEGADFCLDIHGFPDSTESPFQGLDIVILNSYPKLQGTIPSIYYTKTKRIAKQYGLKVDLQSATLENDIVKQAIEYEIPAVLVEHNELGPPETYALIHLDVLRELLQSI